MTNKEIIRTYRASGCYSYREIADIFGITKQRVVSQFQLWPQLYPRMLDRAS